MIKILEVFTFHQAFFFFLGTFCTNAGIMSFQKSGKLIPVSIWKLTSLTDENE